MIDGLPGFFGDGAGTLIFKGMTLSHLLWGLLGAIILVAAAFALQVGKAPRFVKPFASLLRLSAAALVLCVLTEPVLRNEEAIPQQSFLVHLYDTSGSMQIKDYEREPRLSALQRVARNSTPRAELDRLFRGLEFTFDKNLDVLEGAGLPETGDQPTDLVTALRNLQVQIKGLPVSGVVLATDGNATVNNNRQAIVEAAAQLEVPVYPVGAAPRKPEPDVWIEKVVHPEVVATGVGTKITVLTGARGMENAPVEMTLIQDGEELEKRALNPVRDAQTLSAEFMVWPKELGPASYRVKVSTPVPESYPWNNEDDFFMDVVKRKHRILYVEGYPRYEYRFLRAAFEDDKRFQVASMIYVTPTGSAIYRQGLSEESELRKGFPEEQEELFKYDVVVLGDVPVHNFNRKQILALKEFVRTRGGGLLFLAGDYSFDPNGFARTPLAEILPFRFKTSPRLGEEYRVSPTPEGIERGMFGPYDPRLDRKPPWAILPPLKGLFPLGDLKPGAVTLCRIDKGAGPDNPPVVAFQRYGRGMTLVCGISGTWPWRFQTPADNPSYSAFWKEMMLIVRQETDARLQVKAAPAIATTGSEVSVEGVVLDESFQPDPATPATLEIQTPDGGTLTVQAPSAPGGEESREITFRHRLTPAAAGTYKVTARATWKKTGETLERKTMFIVKRDAPELREVRLNEPLLREIASVTGGEYVHLSEYGKLPGLIKPREGSIRKIKEEPVWDRLGVLLAIVGALLTEWLVRRAGSLA